LTVLVLFTIQVNALSCKQLLAVKINTVTSRNFKNFIQYTDHKGMKIPYVDLHPNVEPSGKTVFLVSGFSKNMRAWLPHIRILLKLGHRVVAFDQSNVGYNLLENGLVNIEKGEGLDADAEMAAVVLKEVGVVKNLVILGHSRGAAVAARLAKFAVSNKIMVDRLLLLTPYVRYIWASENPLMNFSESIYDFFAEAYPEYYGQFLHDEDQVKNYEVVEELDSSDKKAALIYILKGLKIQNGVEKTTGEILKDLILEAPDIEVRAFAAEHDTVLAAPEVVQELVQEGVDYSLLKGKTKDHYWPLHYAESMLKAVGLL